MSKILLTADLHRGHKNIHKYRGFDSAEEHDEIMKDNYMQTVGKRDTVMFLGDICFTKEALLDVKTWPGYKIIILGNHCLERVRIEDVADTFDRVYALHNKKGCWLSHAPLHPDHIRGKYCIHGHLHSEVVDDWRYYNVSLEQTNYRPIEFSEVLSVFEDRKKILQEGAGDMYAKP